ncbi:MAG: toll/interleukin-1 receptor domain-containing protein [Betaproteobacteria bacterium]|nr:toll/interleukin-1 receptor domain-containing protein [Betaproteobacteria bacterium]
MPQQAAANALSTIALSYMTADIFISYRRRDAASFAARLRDRLEMSFPGQVFLDVSAIQGGTEFPALLERTARAARVLIAVISPGWLTHHDGSTRLGEAGDFVTLELATALESSVTVIPVLMEGCTMPSVDTLPPRLQVLAQRSALTITHERFDSDAAHLVDALYTHLGIAPPGRIERVLEAASGGTRLHARTRDTFALAAAAVAAVSLPLTGLWLHDYRADPLEGTDVLLFAALGVVLGLVGRHSTKWRRLALPALAVSGIALITYLGAGTWRALSMPMEPWAQSGQIAMLHSHLPELPEERVAWNTRLPFTTPPPSVICECLLRPAARRRNAPTKVELVSASTMPAAARWCSFSRA